MKDHKKFAWFLLDHFHIIFLTFFFNPKGLNQTATIPNNSSAVTSFLVFKICDVFASGYLFNYIHHFQLTIQTIHQLIHQTD